MSRDDIVDNVNVGKVEIKLHDVKKTGAKQQTKDQIYMSMRSAIETSADIQKRLTNAIKPIIDFQEDIRKSLEPVINTLENFREIIQTSLASIDFKAIHEAAIKFEQKTIRFKAIMLELGFPPHNSIPIHNVTRIVDIYDNYGIDYTKRVITRYMTSVVYREEELRNLLSTWQKASWLKRRIKVLKSGVEGHVNGYYDLAVPTFLAQIEGILVEGILAFDEMAASEKIGYGKQKSFLAQVILDNTSSFSFDEEIEKIYTTIILADFERGKEIHSELSRHAILHGEDVEYGTELNSLKAILIFDYIFSKLDELYKDIDESKRAISKKRKVINKANPRKKRDIGKRKQKRSINHRNHTE